MKKLEELVISPAPWKTSQYFMDGRRRRNVKSWRGVQDHVADVPSEADARLIVAAPKLYAKAYEIAENLRIHLAIPTQSITLNRAEAEEMAKKLEDALAEAAGEREVKR